MLCAQMVNRWGCAGRTGTTDSGVAGAGGDDQTGKRSEVLAVSAADHPPAPKIPTVNGPWFSARPRRLCAVFVTILVS